MKKSILQFIPFALASLLVFNYLMTQLIHAGFLTATSGTVAISVLPTVLVAAVGLVATLVLIILKQRYWKFVFFGLTVLALTPLAHFSDSTFTFGIGVLSIDLIALALLIFHLAMNREIGAAIKQKLGIDEEGRKNKYERKAEDFEHLAKRFERKFAHKHKSDLQRIVDENELVPAAVEAAKRLLKEQETTGE